ncbi:hypothetical protein JL101_017670 [Skermanella rosea]|uniref:hypothetical protein n=1 Tax=Skermanella rosea TaxID=1817965 RepID=UPI001934041F|nr:hypothetical protein [Skermanella rosea]UEM01825.1 hypothetical protein JL101_017670 [Skermanella rosea]
MPAIARTLAIIGYAAVGGGLVTAAGLALSLDGWMAIGAALLSGFAGIYAGAMALGFAANLRILSALLDRQTETPPNAAGPEERAPSAGGGDP